MPTITFVSEKKEIQVPTGANLRKEALQAYIGNESTMRLACQTKVNGDIAVTTCPSMNLFGDNFFS